MQVRTFFIFEYFIKCLLLEVIIQKKTVRFFSNLKNRKTKLFFCFEMRVVGNTKVINEFYNSLTDILVFFFF